MIDDSLLTLVRYAQVVGCLIAFAVVLLGCAVMLVAKKMEGILEDACEFIAHPENGTCDFCGAFVGAREDGALVRKGSTTNP
jgi:hypothetical protein